MKIDFKGFFDKDERSDFMQDFETLNEQLRIAIDKMESAVNLPRLVTNQINEAIFGRLKSYVIETKPEEGCCYYVKNVTPETNVCFVHKFTDSQKSFQNIELSELPTDIKKGDVIIHKDGKFIVDEEITNSVLVIRKHVIEEQNTSITLFEEEGKEYMVCDKSDDITSPKMSLRTFDTMQEFWGIEITPELYEQIRYGTVLVYQDGKYIVKQ